MTCQLIILFIDSFSEDVARDNETLNSTKLYLNISFCIALCILLGIDIYPKITIPAWIINIIFIMLK